MRREWIALTLGGAALVVLLALAGNALKVTDQPASSDHAPAVAGAPAVLESGAHPVSNAPAPGSADARRIGSTLVVPPQIEASELERIEPRGPLGEIALALPPKPGVPEVTLLYRPIATAAGRLKAAGHSIVLDGIVAVEPDEQCQARDGSSWPCGMVARTAFRNWLRGRAIECIVGEPPAREAVISACSLGDEDIALWLVENGFASAEPGGPYAEAGEKAEAERRGIFGPGPSR